MIKRSYLDVIHDILSVAINGKRKTHIMYKANLSYTQLNTYLRFLLDIGLLSEYKVDENITIYKTTKKGRTFIKEYCEIMKLLGLHADS